MKNTKDLEYYDRLPFNIILETWNDSEVPYYVARVAELPHCMIHGDTPEEAIREIRTVKHEWIESNLKRGKKIPEPVTRKYSGQISLRIPPSLHRLLANTSTVQEVSLNQFMTMALANFVGFQAAEANREKSEAISTPIPRKSRIPREQAHGFLQNLPKTGKHRRRIAGRADKKLASQSSL